MPINPNDYKGKEQAFVKHVVLDTYLKTLALKVAQFRRGTTFNYIDGFSGPWNTQGPNDRDSSPHIALTALEEVEKQLTSMNIPFTPRAMFVEKHAASFAKLQAKCRAFPNIHSTPYQGEFESRIADAVRFAETGTNPFGFTFIDPTGWTGYALAAITPLLRVQPSEVLINFMWEFISRFVNDPDSPGFQELFGGVDPTEWTGLEKRDREDKVVEVYCDCIRRAGGFKHVVSAIVLNRVAARTHYHLIYATRTDTGLVTFRAVEAKALRDQHNIRSQAKLDDQVAKTGQQTLFGAAEMVDMSDGERLVERYQRRARRAVELILKPGTKVDYDQLVRVALRHPMTSEQPLKTWLREWKQHGRVKFEIPADRRIPHFGEGHRIVVAL